MLQYDALTPGHISVQAENTAIDEDTQKSFMENIFTYRKNLFVHIADKEIDKLTSAGKRSAMRDLTNALAMANKSLIAYDEFVRMAPAGFKVNLAINQNDHYPILMMQVIAPDASLHFSVTIASLDRESSNARYKALQDLQVLEHTDQLVEYVMVEQSVPNLGTSLLKYLLSIISLSSNTTYKTHFLLVPEEDKVNKVLQFVNLDTGHWVSVIFRPIDKAQ